MSDPDRIVLEAPNQHSEELLVHVLMSLNNLSYYDDPQSYIIRNADTLAQCNQNATMDGFKSNGTIDSSFCFSVDQIY